MPWGRERSGRHPGPADLQMMTLLVNLMRWVGAVRSITGMPGVSMRAQPNGFHSPDALFNCLLLIGALASKYSTVRCESTYGWKVKSFGNSH